MHALNVVEIEREIERLLIDYPELTEDETLRADMIDGETDAKAVLSRVVSQMHEAKMMSAAIAKRISDLQPRQVSFDRRADAMRDLAMRIMDAANLRKMMLPEATLSVRTTPPSVVISDESLIPAQYKKTKMEISRTALREALQAGVEIPGAALSNGGASLSVRTK